MHGTRSSWHSDLFFKLLPLSIFSKSKKKNCLSNLTKKDNPICLSARGDTWLPSYSRKLSRAHQEKLVCHSFHCSCHYIGLHVMSLSLSHFQKIGMYSNLISLPCQVWKSHVYREGRELHSGGEGQGACLHQGFREMILPSILFSISSKADLIHAFLSVADLQHSVLSPVSFRLEYKRGSTAPAMFQRQVTEK